MVFVVSQDAESMLATADGQFQFPGSVVSEFKLDAVKMVFTTMVGGAV